MPSNLSNVLLFFKLLALQALLYGAYQRRTGEILHHMASLAVGRIVELEFSNDSGMSSGNYEYVIHVEKK